MGNLLATGECPEPARSFVVSLKLDNGCSRERGSAIYERQL
jgi:hypothetical protein